MKHVKLYAFVLLVAAVLWSLAACTAPQPLPGEVPAGEEPAAEEPSEPEAAAPETAKEVDMGAACPNPGGSLVFATSIDVPSLEPHLESADAWHRRKVLVYENLTWVDNDVVPQPQLAESWEISDDGLEYVFHLREGVMFHNGKELDAEDVKYSLERQLDPEVGSAGRGDLTMIATIEVLDDYTLRITLVSPTGPFLAALGGRYNAVIPKDSAPDGETLRRTAIGTGPFMVDEFVPGERLVLTKNDNYWDEGKPCLDELTIQVIPDEQSTLAGLRAGTIDMAALEDANNYLLLENEPDLVLTRTPAIKHDTFELPCDIEPLTDPRVRRAIALAIDQEEIMEAGALGLGRVAGVMPMAMGFWALPPEELPYDTRDLERSQELLEEAGYPDGFDMTLRTIVGYGTMAANAPVIADNLSDIGINVDVETVDLGVWIEDWRNRREPVTLNAWGGFMDPDLLFYRHFHQPPDGVDFRRCGSEELDALLDAGRSTVDPDERQQIYHEVQRKIAEDSSMLSLYSGDLLNVKQPYVEGYVQHPSGWYYGFTDTWLDR